jgi:hypothetical protein
MKKIILLSATILSTLVSCSTDDETNYKQDLVIKKSNEQSNYDFNATSRDSIGKTSDSINGSVNPKPIKP